MRQSVTFCLRISASSPCPHPEFSSSISFFALRRINNQCRSQYCRYEINLPPAVLRAMLLQENQCPPHPSLVVLWGWTGCTHICSHNTNADLAVREWAREREWEREEGERGCGEIADSVVYQSFIKLLCCQTTCDIRLWVSQPSWGHAGWGETPAYVDRAR